jgi:hypothetical protein
VAEVRRIFFNFLKPFLVELPKYFREEDYINNLKEQEKVFSKYFDQRKFLDTFEGELDLVFAK